MNEENNKPKRRKLTIKDLLITLLLLVLVVAYAKAEYRRGIHNGEIKLCKELGGEMLVYSDPQDSSKTYGPFCGNYEVIDYADEVIRDQFMDTNFGLEAGN